MFLAYVSASFAALKKIIGLALMAFISTVFVGYNTIAFPVEFYGSDRLTLANYQFFLGILAFCGFIWHRTKA